MDRISIGTCCPICAGAEGELFCTADDRHRIDPLTSYRILRCPRCGVGWTNPSPVEADMARYYPEDYLGETSRLIDEYRSGNWIGTASWRMQTEKVKLLERYCRGGSLLDVGCGEGKFLWALDAGRWKRSGIELNFATVRLVREAIPEIEIHQGSIDSVDLPPGQFDVITFWHALEHLPCPEAALTRAFRRLKPGGWIIVSAPNIASLQARWFRSNWYPFGDVPRHLFHFSPRSLEILFQNAGFEKPRFRFFSKKVNFHCWKHSMRAWCRSRFGSEKAYYVFKPALHLLPILEKVREEFAIMTAVAPRAGDEIAPATLD
jgi:SAM-dependent methyltransferase